MQTKLRLGTRGSPLALAQAHTVRAQLLQAHPSLEDVEIVVISTKGDEILDQPLAEIGGKGLFTESIENQLLSGDIDLAVHSTKDMPTELPDGLDLLAFLQREDPRDALISRFEGGLDGLPQGAVVGTASLRRQAQLLHIRPDLKVVSFRGNVQTRLRKLAAGEVDATLLAQAGLNRLGMQDLEKTLLNEDVMLPAPAQGAVCVEAVANNGEMAELLAAIDHQLTRIAVTAERHLLAGLDGNCRTPIAALATIDQDAVNLKARVLDLRGESCFEMLGQDSVSRAAQLGQKLAVDLRAQAGSAFFESLKSQMQEQRP